MKDKDLLRIDQLEQVLAPHRSLLSLKRPRLGWIRAIREALGMSAPQLARRLDIKAAQSIEDMQEDEVTGAIRLRTLQKVANAMECDLVYALVPRKSIHDICRDRAAAIAQMQVGRVSHSMRLEDQEVSRAAELNALRRRIDKLLSGSPRKLWD